MVDDRSAVDADIWSVVGATERCGNGRTEIGAKENRAGFRVDRVDRVAFGGDIDDFMFAGAGTGGDFNVRHDEGLSVDLIVEDDGVKQLEFRALDVVRFEMFFVAVPSGAEIVVVVGGDGNALFFTTREKGGTNEGNRKRKAICHTGTPLPKIGESLRGESGTYVWLDWSSVASLSRTIAVTGLWKRALALAASSSRLRGEAEVSRDRRRRWDAAVISSMASSKAAALVLDGL